MTGPKRIDPVERVGLVRNPGAGTTDVISLAMHVTGDVKTGLLTMDDDKLVLADANTVQPSMDFGMADCQTCTLYMSIRSSFEISDDKPANVKVTLGKDPVTGRPMIIIS
jgi:hypothetical protein